MKNLRCQANESLANEFLEAMFAQTKPEVQKVLLDEAILYRFKTALDKLITGEDRNKLLLFLIAVTSFMKKVLGAIITGESSAGKSHLVNAVLKFFGNVEEYSRITQASPDRIGRNFSGKILKVEELRGTEAAQASLRVWISEGKLKLLTTTRDEKGRITTEVVETDGVPCFMTTTTSVSPDAELLNRLFLISVDESEPQTKKVLEYEAQEFMNPDFDPNRLIPNDLKQAVEFIAGTPFNQVLIPYAADLAKAFPSKNVKARRDFKKLLFLVGAVAFLHQMQRPIVYKEKTMQFVIALPIDFLIAWEIAADSMKATLMNVQKRSMQVLELFSEAETLTSRHVATETGLSQNRAREILNGLVELGYLLKDESGKEHKFSLKKENADPDVTIADFGATAVNFDEKQFGEWLNEKNLITRYRGTWVDFYSSPLTGDRVFSSCGRVLKIPESEQETGAKQEIIETEDTNSSIVSLSRRWQGKPALLAEMETELRELFLQKIQLREDEIVDFIEKHGYSREEAESWHERNKGSLYFMNPEGFWKWA